MNPSPHREEALFELALGKPPEKRAAWLDAECEGDPALRQRLEALLAAHEQSGGLNPPGQLVTTIKLEPIEDPEDAAVGQKIGRYKILEKVGEGGCGVVYVAEQTEQVRRRVALKVIKLGMDTKQVVARFEAERQALALMDHPNIAKVLDAGSTDSGRPYFVMELVRGIKITEFCDQEKLSTKERLDLFIKICSAIQHAHQKGIIHRDIKPSNILVTLHDGVPVPKVIDFGIAKATEGKLTDATVYTQLHQFIGTPAYMSPEQAEMSGLDIDTRSDIYSLGVLLYELLAGSTPFDAQQLMSQGIDAMRKTIREQEPQRPSTRLATLGADQLTTTAKRRSADTAKLLHQLKGDLDWIVMKCLEKDRARRYETANGLAADIKRHLNNEPVTARPPSTTYRLQKAFRRNKLAFAAATAVSLALLVGIVASTWQAVRAMAAEKKAHAEANRATEAEKREMQQRLKAQNEEAIARQRAYAADMLLCGQALKANNLREARQLLDRQRPKDGEEDLRGWEWRWLWNACRSDGVFEMSSQNSRVLQAIYVDNGRSIVTYEDGGAVYRTHLDSRRVETLREAVESPTRSLRSNSGLLCSSHDRRWIAALGIGESGYLVRVWDVLRSAPPREIAVGEALVSAIGISPDGSTLVTYCPDSNSASVWDIRSPSMRRTRTIDLKYSRRTLNAYGAVRFSPDGRTLAVGGAGAQVRLMNVSEKIEDWSDKGELTMDTGLDQSISSLDFSPDGRLLASGCMFVDPRVFITEVSTGRNIAALSGHKGFIGGLAFSPDGKTLASASSDQTVKIWDTATWQERGTHLGHTDEVWSVNFSPDGAQLISGGKDRKVEVWSATQYSNREGTQLNAVPVPYARSLDSAPGCRRFVYIANGVVTLADDANQTAPVELGTNIFKAFWTSPDRIVALSKAPFEIKVWDLPSNQTESFALDGDASGRVMVNYFPDSNLIVLGAPGEEQGETIVTRWDVASRQKLSVCRLPIARLLAQQAGCFSNDGMRMAVSDWDSVVIYDSVNGTRKTTIAVPSKSGIQGIALSPDGEQLAVASRDKPEILIRDVDTGRHVTTLLGHNLVILTLDYSSDGKRLLSSAIGTEQVKVWSTEIWQEVARLEPPAGVFFGRPRFTSDDAAIFLPSYKFGSGLQGIRLFRAPSWDEIAKAETRGKTEAVLQ